MVESKTAVLFLCTGNSARSQMAEAFLRTYAGDHFEVYSAGTEAKGIHPYTIRVMDELGIDIRQQRSERIGSIGGLRYYYYIITVCPRAEQNCPTDDWVLGSQRLHWPFENPAEAEGSEDERLQKFRQVRDEVEGRIKNWLKELEPAR